MQQRQVTCEGCGCSWMRPIQRGRVPKLCADCRASVIKERNRKNRKGLTVPRDCVQCGRAMATPEKKRRGPRRRYCFECAPPGYHPKKVLGRVCAREGCGQSLDAKSAVAKYCSTECGERASGRRVTATLRECPVCRASFEATGNQRFCPPLPGEAKSKCAKAYTNAKSRGTLDKLLAEPWTPPAPFDCAYCGKRCVPGENVAQHAARFCGAECKSNWHRFDTEGATYRYSEKERQRREKERERSAPLRKRREKRREAQRRLDAALRAGQPRRWFEGPCRGCGERTIGCASGSWKSHYCSRTCRNRDARSRRRARKRKAFVEEVWRPVLFERDNWTCQLCGDAVNPSLKYPDPMAATIDHIVPLVDGGEHSYANTQLAHALCNSLKGDRETGSMMFAA